MSKVNSARITAIKANFEHSDVITEENLADLIDAIAEAAEAHEHTASGGDGTGAGDAGPVANLQSGTAAAKPANPEVGDVYLETDTSKLYACFSVESWTEIVAGSGKAPDDASYVTVNAEESLSAETQHANLSGGELHDPKSHTHTESDVTDLDHDAQKIKGQAVDAPVAGDDGKLLQYDHGNSKYTHAEPEADLPSVTVGDNLCVSADTERETDSATYVKLKEITVYRPGSYRIKFDLYSGPAALDPSYGRIYKNGSPVGTERSKTKGKWETYSEDFSGIAKGDLIQLYAKTEDDIHPAKVRNFRIYYAEGSLDGYVTLD